MTLKELSQLYWLSREIEADQKRLDELSRIAGEPSSSVLTDMPRSPQIGRSSKIERLVAEIVDLRAVIAAKQIQCIHERARLERWINNIPDSQTRMIFRYRFVSGMSWEQVAEAIGGNTEYSVKKRCYRYIKTAADEVASSDI
jgi:hypothetical protein